MSAPNRLRVEILFCGIFLYWECYYATDKRFQRKPGHWEKPQFTGKNPSSPGKRLEARWLGWLDWAGLLAELAGVAGWAGWAGLRWAGLG